MYALTVEDWVRRNLDDTNTLDYFPGSGELEAFCWAYTVYRYEPVTLVLYPVEQRMTPITTPGVSHFWSYPYSQYVPTFWNYLFRWRMLDSLHQKNHKFGMFQTNVFGDGSIVSPRPMIDEIALTVDFGEEVTGAVTMTGYPLNLSRLMAGVFLEIASDLAKLAILQSTLGSTVDSRDAATHARKMAQAWLAGGTIRTQPMRRGRSEL